jgi:hypothetical protein
MSVKQKLKFKKTHIMKNSRIVLAVLALAALAATGFSTAKSKSVPAAQDCCAEGGDCCKPAAGCCNK